jgi:predicted transcriptional regulator
MSKQNVISARVSDEVLAKIDRIAELRDRSRAWIVSTLIEAAARDELEFREFLQAGIDSADQGKLIPQEEAEKWYEDRIANRSTQIAAE